MSSSFHRSKEWMAFSRRWRPIIQARIDASGGEPCVNGWRFGCVVVPGQRWDLAHIVDRHLAPGLALEPSNVGPSCIRHNRSDGGKAGAAITNRRRARAAGRQPTTERFMKW